MPIRSPNLICLSLLLSLGAHAALAENSEFFVPGGGGEYGTKIKSFSDLKFRNVVRQRYDYSCGSAAVATLLTYHYGIPVDEMDVMRDMYWHGNQEKITREGFSLLDMKKFLGSIGLRAEGYREPLDKLAKVGIPAIVLINRGGYLHFVVVKGVTPEKVLIGDSAAGLRVEDRKTFEENWNGILFVVTDNMVAGRSAFNQSEQWPPVARAAFSDFLSDADLGRISLDAAFSPGYFY